MRPRGKTAGGEVVRDIVDRGVIERGRAFEDRVDPEGAARAGVDVVLADELAVLGEFHDLAGMKRAGVDGIAIGGEQVSIRRETQGKRSAPQLVILGTHTNWCRLYDRFLTHCRALSRPPCP